MTKDYDIDDKLQELQNLEEISDSNKNLLTEFVQYLRADSDVSCQRQYKYLYNFKTLLTSDNKEDKAFIQFDLKGASKDDMRKAVGKIQASSYSEWSKRDMKVSLKKLFRTIHEEETERPKRVKKILNAQFMKTGKKIAEKLGEEDPDGSLWATKPFKPKNMHWETYEELIQEWEYWDELHNIIGLKKMRDMVGELEKSL